MQYIFESNITQLNLTSKARKSCDAITFYKFWTHFVFENDFPLHRNQVTCGLSPGQTQQKWARQGSEKCEIFLLIVNQLCKSCQLRSCSSSSPTCNPPSDFEDLIL